MDVYAYAKEYAAHNNDQFSPEQIFLILRAMPGVPEGNREPTFSRGRLGASLFSKSSSPVNYDHMRAMADLLSLNGEQQMFYRAYFENFKRNLSLEDLYDLSIRVRNLHTIAGSDDLADKIDRFRRSR
jgi:hypothetical protein